MSRADADARDPARNDRDGPCGHAVQTAADVRQVLAEEIEQLTANPDLDPLRKAGRLAQLAQVMLRAIALATLEARVEAVEAVLRLRKHDRTPKEGSR
jgi:hypothetical protein